MFSAFERFFHERLRVPPRVALLLALDVAGVAFGSPSRTSIVIGLIVSVLGELLRIIAAGYGYGALELSLRGPYRFVRHPYFLGTALLHLGVCIASRNPYVMAAGIVLIVLTHRRRLRRDEAIQRERLGPRFVEYAARVPAFLPQLLPVAAPDTEKRKFSLTLAVLTGRHRELNALLGLALVFVLLELAARGLGGSFFRPVVVVTTLAYAAFRLLYHWFNRGPLVRR